MIVQRTIHDLILNIVQAHRASCGANHILPCHPPHHFKVWSSIKILEVLEPN